MQLLIIQNLELQYDNDALRIHFKLQPAQDTTYTTYCVHNYYIHTYFTIITV